MRANSRKAVVWNLYVKHAFLGRCLATEAEILEAVGPYVTRYPLNTLNVWAPKPRTRKAR